MSGYVPIEDLDFFSELEDLADEIYDHVAKWKQFDRDTVGKQLVRSTDSVGANLVEGDARFSDKESLHFFYIARGSIRESRYWLRRALHRKQVNENVANNLLERLESIRRRLNAIITSRRQRVELVREERAIYEVDGEFGVDASV